MRGATDSLTRGLDPQQFDVLQCFEVSRHILDEPFEDVGWLTLKSELTTTLPLSASSHLLLVKAYHAVTRLSAA